MVSDLEMTWDYKRLCVLGELSAIYLRDLNVSEITPHRY